MAVKHENYYERQMRRLFGDSNVLLDGSIFFNRTMIGKIEGGLRVKVEFVTSGIIDNYDSLRLTIINRTQGAVDTQTFRFSDIIGWKNNIRPYILEDNVTTWYGYIPTAEDCKKIQDKVEEYIGMYVEPSLGYNGPTMEMR